MFYFRVTILPSQERPALTDDLLRLLVWVVADGTMVDDRKYNPGSSKRRIQFKLSRPEKIEKLQTLLTRMKMPYTLKECKKHGVNKLQPYYIRIYGDYGREIFDRLDGVKQFPAYFREFSEHQLRLVLSALLDTDASQPYNKLVWNTTAKNDAEVIHCLCDKHGLSFQMTELEHASGFKQDCKTQYRCRIGEEEKYNYSKLISACLTYPASPTHCPASTAEPRTYR